MAILSTEHLSYTYQSKYQKVYALKDVTCRFELGNLYAIIGKSGSGKTTLLSMLAGLGAPTDGSVYFDGEDIRQIGGSRHRRENVSVIYQSFNLFPKLNVLENTMYPMQISRVPKEEAVERALGLLESVGLSGQEKKFPAMLSGGEQQRAAIARALASRAKVILADEPTGNLDQENGRTVMRLLRNLTEKDERCVIMVTHDRDLTALAYETLRIVDGKFMKEECRS